MYKILYLVIQPCHISKRYSGNQVVILSDWYYSFPLRLWPGWLVTCRVQLDLIFSFVLKNRCYILRGDWSKVTLRAWVSCGTRMIVLVQRFDDLTFLWSQWNTRFPTRILVVRIRYFPIEMAYEDVITRICQAQRLWYIQGRIGATRYLPER